MIANLRACDKAHEKEWAGVTVCAFLEDFPEGTDVEDVDPGLLFISTDERADYEARLLFPEYFL